MGDALYYKVAAVDTLIGIVVSVGNTGGDMTLKVRANVPTNTNGPLLAVDTKFHCLALSAYIP